MISRMLIGSKLLVVGLWLAICFQMVSAGETNTSAVKSNLAVMQEVVKEITREIVDSAHISANDSLIVLFGAGEDVWIVQNSMIAELKAFGCQVFSESIVTSDNRIVLENTGVESHARYADMFRDGFLGTKKMKRTISAGFSCKVIRKKTDEILFSGLFTKQSIDTVIVDDVPQLETASAKSTHGELPSDSFFDRILEPFVIIGATGVAVYLFFNV